MFCADPLEQVVQLRGSSGGKHKLACRSGFKYGIGSPSSKKYIKQAPGQHFSGETGWKLTAKFCSVMTKDVEF
jgi:hypothetical protein